AEDGIRDLTVTGVQTCALPILRATAAAGRRRPDVGKIHCNADLAADPGTGNVFASQHAETKTQAIANCVLAATHGLKLASPQARSEERRVGKEGEARWTRDV